MILEQITKNTRIKPCALRVQTTCKYFSTPGFNPTATDKVVLVNKPTVNLEAYSFFSIEPKYIKI